MAEDTAPAAWKTVELPARCQYARSLRYSAGLHCLFFLIHDQATHGLQLVQAPLSQLAAPEQWSVFATGVNHCGDCDLELDDQRGWIAYATKSGVCAGSFSLKTLKLLSN